MQKCKNKREHILCRVVKTYSKKKKEKKINPVTIQLFITIILFSLSLRLK